MTGNSVCRLRGQDNGQENHTWRGRSPTGGRRGGATAEATPELGRAWRLEPSTQHTDMNAKGGRGVEEVKGWCRAKKPNQGPAQCGTQLGAAAPVPASVSSRVWCRGPCGLRAGRTA